MDPESNSGDTSGITTFEPKRHPSHLRADNLKSERLRAELAAAEVPYVSPPEPFPNKYAPTGFNIWLPRYEEVEVNLVQGEWPRNQINEHLTIRCIDAVENSWLPEFKSRIYQDATLEGWKTFYAWLAMVAPGQPDLYRTIDWGDLTKLVQKFVKTPNKGKGGRTRALKLAQSI